MDDFAIRLATPADEAGILALCWAMHDEIGTRQLSQGKVAAVVRGVLNDRQLGVIGVIGPAEDIQALCFLHITSIWFSDDLELHDALTFVRADCRKSTRAKSLIAWAKRNASELHLPLWMHVISDVRTEAKVRLYRRQVPKIGEYFCYSPKIDEGLSP